jgi:hypothetical protein
MPGYVNTPTRTTGFAVTRDDPRGLLPNHPPRTALFRNLGGDYELQKCEAAQESVARMAKSAPCLRALVPAGEGDGTNFGSAAKNLAGLHPAVRDIKVAGTVYIHCLPQEVVIVKIAASTWRYRDRVRRHANAVRALPLRKDIIRRSGGLRIPPSQTSDAPFRTDLA